MEIEKGMKIISMRGILSRWWKIRYKGNYDIVWFNDLVDMETGKDGISEYHKVDSIKESLSDRIAIKRMTRAEAENKYNADPCDYCFPNILPIKRGEKIKLKK